MTEPCAICTRVAAEPAIYEEERWLLYPIEPPTPVLGWVYLCTRRHATSAADFDALEAERFGSVLARVTRVLAELSRAPRIYTAALGEKVPHFHAHLVPRAEGAPRGFALFGEQARAAAALGSDRAPSAQGLPTEAEARAFIERLRDALRRPPG